jgi:signal transduction histidine kinase
VAERRATSLRRRITLGATAAVTLALVLGAVVFGLVLRGALVDGARASAEAYAADLAARIDGSGTLDGDALEGDDDDRFWIVVGDDDEVVAASESATELALSQRLLDDLGDGVPVTVPGDDTSYIVAFGDTSGDLEVIAGVSSDDIDETLGTVTTLLAMAVPLVALLVAITTWVVVGRALRPVERMRREADAVTATRLDRRIDDPGTADEIGRLAATLNRMLDRLDSSQRSQRRFVSDASHELRSPLASLRQFAEVARVHPDRIDAADLSEAILDEGARLERLVDSMLTLAKADEGVLSLSHRPVDLDDIALAEVRRVRSATAVSVDASAVGAARVLGDPDLLAQVVRNLVDNAARHADRAIAMSLVSVNGTADIVLTVDDDGDGVSGADAERVFERFVRLDDARARDSGGSGLGLAIVREIVRAHGGRVTVGTSPLGGARFEVRLPAASVD